jgi:hypothetical protein
VTAEAVNAFARERLGADNRAFLIYVPKESDERSAISDQQDVAATIAAEG